jgi:hypothetical protein
VAVGLYDRVRKATRHLVSGCSLASLAVNLLLLVAVLSSMLGRY